MRKDLKPYSTFMAPGVEMHCLFGNSDESVTEILNFDQSLKSNPMEIKGQGDGTVNRRSLIGCDYWKNTPAQRNYAIYQLELADVEHYDIVSESKTIDYITKTLFGASGYTEIRKIQKTTHQKVMRVRIF